MVIAVLEEGKTQSKHGAKARPTENTMQHDSIILEHTSTGVLALDNTLQLIAINATGQMLLETSESRCLGLHVSKALPHPDKWLSAIDQVRETNSPYTSRSVSLLLPSGQDLVVDLIITPVPDNPADIALVVELLAVDRLLKISREEGLNRARETTQAVIRGLAHEIKNPLGGLRGAAQLLARELPNEQLAEYTNVIIRESDRLRDLVDQLLGPRRKLEKQNHNIHEILEHVRNLIEAETAHAVSIHLDYDPSLPELSADRAQLIQAFLNIMRNALQAAERVEECEITLRTRAQRQFTVGSQRHRLVARVDIIDNGPGVPQDIAHSLFAPMVTGRADGTGLGLAIAQSILNRHGGAIECDSQPGSTRFSLFLPMEQ